VLRLWLLRIRLLLVGLVRPTGLLVVAQWIPQYFGAKVRVSSCRIRGTLGDGELCPSL
jgi:hypothetical protein